GKADTLIRCAIDMMKSLAIGIKASGVDTPDLEKYALEIGADKIQGFALSRFLSGADLIKFVREKEGRS
ncbi:MAG: EAL domain-containing protein, partial [Lachnospiraceae bacterium]|nr:EAL domain-containing protein [Lachnospiraceae bacterium]